MKSPIDKSELLTGSILKQVIRLATPMIIAFIFVTSYQYIDRLFVSKLGDIATAAIGMAFIIQLIIISIGVGIGSGINSYIARNLGADRPETANRVVYHAFILALVIGISITIIGLLIQKPIYQLIGADGNLLVLILDYLTIILFFTPFNLLAMFCNSIFQGWGDTMSPMKYMLIGNFVNLLFDWLLIFGIGPFPELGIRGAAWATGIGRGVVLTYVFIDMFVRHRPIQLSFKNFSYDRNIITGIFQVGLPSSASQVLTGVAMGFIFYILNQFGADAKAAYTIVFTYEMVIFLPAIGVSQAVTILTGHNFGARALARLKKIYSIGILTAFAMMAITSGIIFFGSDIFAGIFAQSDAVLKITSTALKFSAIGAIFISIYMCSIASFQGLGLGREYLMANVIKLYILQVPLAFLGGYFYGLEGVWIGLMAVNIIGALAVFIWHQFIYNYRVLTGQIQPL